MMLGESTNYSEVLRAMETTGFYLNELNPDGKIYRFQRDRHDKGKSSWYVLHQKLRTNGSPYFGACWGDWRDGTTHRYQPNTKDISPEELDELRRKIEESKNQQRIKQEKIWEDISLEVLKKWNLLTDKLDSDYLKAKEVGGSLFGCKTQEDPAGRGVTLHVPMRDMYGKLWSLQSIDSSGNKLFRAGGKKLGNFHVIGTLGEDDPILIAEGLATAASIHMASGRPVVVAFDCGNLLAVSIPFRKKYPDRCILICGDDDQYSTRGNAGRTKATESASCVRGSVVFPSFKDLSCKPTDFNDLHRLEGLEEVRKQISNALTGQQPDQPPRIDSEWEKPVSMSDPRLSEFPLQVIPSVLREFGRELAEFTETPVEFSILSELAVVSVAIARCYEVEIKPGYTEPTNIWVCPALESGNRKSAVHSECTLPLLEWEQEQRDAQAPKIREILSKRKSEESYIQSLRAKLGKATDPGERASSIAQIAELESNLPEVPVSPQLWSSDLTPEKLGIVMAENNERIGLISDEGGIFDLMGGRYSSGALNLDIYLKGHAGSPERIERTNRPPVLLSRPALTIAISPQPSVLQELAGIPSFRGRGLLARFLFAVPQSLVGYRTGKGKAPSITSRSDYKNLIRSLVKSTFEENEHRLKPTRLIQLSNEALRFWTEFSQEIEPKLREYAQLHTIRDWSGKLPGAAARIAGILHAVKHAYGSPADVSIDGDTMLSAIGIADALIPHALKVFGMMGADPLLEDAKYVLRWIEKEQLQYFSQRDCHNALQRRFRRVNELIPALNVLVERHYLRPAPSENVTHRPRKKFLVNPIVGVGELS